MDVLAPMEIRIPKENNDMARLREHAEWVRSRLADDTGAATAEYAVATMATVDKIGRI